MGMKSMKSVHSSSDTWNNLINAENVTVYILPAC
jgi:hypothetical protein